MRPTANEVLEERTVIMGSIVYC